MKSIISCVEKLSFPMKTHDPFLFCVYHKDHYPAGDDKMQAPRRGNGADFNPSADYRMYHGDRIPGFPQHPHRGFETVTATIEGLIDHSDSCGNAGRYGKGDLQWMTAGKGVVHGEMFPLLNTNSPNPTKFFQIWLNLPSRSKMVDPAFAMHWAEDVPKYVSEDEKAKLTIWAGEYGNKKALLPPPNSWAAAKNNADVGIYLIELKPGGQFTLPAAKLGNGVNCTAYFVEGDSLTVGSDNMPKGTSAKLNASEDALFHNRHASLTAEVLILQGKPIGEPVAQHGPFVMNTQSEIRQAFEDYQRTRFGGWPWKDDAMVFPREKGRFSLIDGTETYPPKVNNDDNNDNNNKSDL